MSAWLLSLIGLLVLLGFVSNEQTEQMCTGLEVWVNKSEGNFFVVEEDIKQMVADLGYELEDGSEALDQIDISAIETILNDHPSIKNADVYATIRGSVRIDVEQRTPLFRVFCPDGDSYYVDKEGWPMPLSNKYTSRVLVANGNIDLSYVNAYQLNVAGQTAATDSIVGFETVSELYHLASFLEEDDFWKAQLSQVFVNADGEIELIPRVGNHTILIGDATNLQQKMDKLMLFYKNGLSKTGWNEYKVINLKYKNQIVCTKR